MTKEDFLSGHEFTYQNSNGSFLFNNGDIFEYSNINNSEPYAEVINIFDDYIEVKSKFFNMEIYAIILFKDCFLV